MLSLAANEFYDLYKINSILSFQIHIDSSQMYSYSKTHLLSWSHMTGTYVSYVNLQESYIPIMNPASVKLRNNPERLSTCYKEVTDNIQEPTVLGELYDFVVVVIM